MSEPPPRALYCVPHVPYLTIIHDLVYTCSNRDTGCKFFLWDDDARARENDRASEPKLIPQPPTPRTTPRRSSRINPTPPSAQAPPPTKRRISDLDLDSSASDFESEDEDEVEVDDGNDDDDNDLDEISYNWNGPITRAHGVSTPRKERRTSARTSPSKARFPRTGLATPISGAGRRFFAEAMAETNDEDGDDIFNTPPVFSARNNIFAPLATPKSAARLLGSPGRGLRDDLITDVFALLTKHNVNLKESARELRELLKRQVWQKEGISQGREVARQALARKTEECEELKAQVEELDAEKADAEREQETLRSQMFELTNELGM